MDEPPEIGMSYTDASLPRVDSVQYRWLPWICLFFVILASAPAHSQPATDSRKILFLFDANSPTVWTSSFVGEFRRTISATSDDFDVARYSYEFLGLSDYPPGTQLDALLELLTFKQ